MAADLILMHFVPRSQSPITLLEFGLQAASGKLIVVSPPGFWRRGNIEVVAARYDIPLLDDLTTALARVKRRLAIMSQSD